MKKFFKNSGFTLFELLAVLAILAIVAGIAVPRVMQTITNSRVQALEAEMELVANSIQRMLMEEEINTPGNSPGINMPIFFLDSSLEGGDAFQTVLAALNAEYTIAINDVTDFPAASATTNAPNPRTFTASDYIDGGIPAYLMVIVSDTDGNNEATISVIYDEDENTNVFGNVVKQDLIDANGTNVLTRTVVYSGTNTDS